MDCAFLGQRLKLEPVGGISDIISSFGSTSPWNRGTVIVVGQGRAGKSAVIDALVGKCFKKGGYESTVGVEHCSREISHSVVREGRSWEGRVDDSHALEEIFALQIVKRYVLFS